MNEKELRAKVVAAAEGFYGCKESDGSHKLIIDTYNSATPLPSGYKMTYTDFWCAAYVSAVGVKVGLSDIIFRECSCDRMIILYKNAGRWIENDAYMPQEGDIVFYDWDDNGVGDNIGSSDHVGIIVSISGTTMKIIEGNISNAVGYRTLQVNARYIRGYGIPNYTSKTTVSGSSVNLGNTGSTLNNANTGGNETMKYNTSNKPLVCMQTNSTCYKNTNKMAIKGVLWHSTGANNPWLKRYVQPSNGAPDKVKWLSLLGENQNKNDWNHIYIQAGLNAWIGKLADGTVAAVQTMPWDYRPWGCGSGSRGSCNNGWIQFEIAEDSLNDRDYFNKVYKEACELTAYLCKIYNLNPKGTVNVNGVKVPVILCHKDSYNLGMGSNHADVYHWFNRYGKSMDDVRRDVASLLSKVNVSSTTSTNKPNNVDTPSSEIYRIRKSWKDAKTQIGAYRELENAKAACDKAGDGYYVFNSVGVSIYPKNKAISYLVKVTADNLNIRKGAGTNYGVIGTIKNKGVYTIVEEATGQGATKWGLLKSYQKNRNGWISLDFVKKV